MMEQINNYSAMPPLASRNIVDIHYLQTGRATTTDELGMREMQALSLIHI